MTTNVLIAFGGIALLGIIGFAFVWVASAVSQRKERQARPARNPTPRRSRANLPEGLQAERFPQRVILTGVSKSGTAFARTTRRPHPAAEAAAQPCR